MTKTTSFRRSIALGVVLTLGWMLYVTSAPLSAFARPADASESITSDGTPGAIERTAPQSASSKKSSLVPILIGVLAAGAIAALLIFVVFKTSYDITGTWDVAYQWPGMTSPDHFFITFTGNTSSGTFIYDESGDTNTGTYTQDGKNVSWTFTGSDLTYTGAFSDKNTMSGTMTYPGNWTATRTNSAASTTAPTALARTRGRNGAGKMNQ